MFNTFKYIFALVGFGIVISAMIISWNRFTDKPRPDVLEDLNNFLRNTQFGINIAQVLGATDETAIEKIDIRKSADEIYNALRFQAEERAKNIIITQAVRQLYSQFNNLSGDQRSQIRDLICEPSEEN